MYIHKPYYENCKRSLTHTQTHTHTHAHTHARTHAHTHTHTHTHYFDIPYVFCLCSYDCTT